MMSSVAMSWLLLLMLLLAFVLCVGSFICTLNAFYFVAISLAIIANNVYHNDIHCSSSKMQYFYMYALHVCVYVMLCGCLLHVYSYSYITYSLACLSILFLMCAFSIKCMLVHVHIHLLCVVFLNDNK